MPIPTPSCPECHSEHVKPVTIWQMASADGTAQVPPQPMFACQEHSCMHKWARVCEHTVQRLIDVSYSDTSKPPMGRYGCADCFAEIIRPYEEY